jgi:hypothetical protein
VTFDQFKALLEIVGIVVTGALGFWGIMWKLTKYFHKNDARIEQLVTIVNKLTTHSERSGREFVALKTMLEAREKDVLRLEGVSDATRKDLLELMKDLRIAVSKIDALWTRYDKVRAQLVDKRS